MWLLLCGVAAVSAGYVGLKSWVSVGGYETWKLWGAVFPLPAPHHPSVIRRAVAAPSSQFPSVSSGGLDGGNLCSGTAMCYN